MIIKLLKTFKVQQFSTESEPLGGESLDWVYRIIKAANSKVHHYILKYFRSLLVKVYLFNRNIS